MKVLLLDDDPNKFDSLVSRNPSWEVVWVQRVSSFLHCARNYKYDMIFMDHDLRCSEGYEPSLGKWFPAMREFTGHDAVKMMASNPGKSAGTAVCIHSCNQMAADKMQCVLLECHHYPKVEIREI